jgi:hypothetical protein
LDTCVTYTYTDKTYYCTVTLYGLYHEWKMSVVCIEYVLKIENLFKTALESDKATHIAS